MSLSLRMHILEARLLHDPSGALESLCRWFAKMRRPRDMALQLGFQGHPEVCRWISRNARVEISTSRMLYILAGIMYVTHDFTGKYQDHQDHPPCALRGAPSVLWAPGATLCETKQPLRN